MKNSVIVAIKDGKLLFFKKDKTLVDILDSECIMGYTEAAELERKLPHNIKRLVVYLGELVLSNKDISHKLFEQYVAENLT